jgi:hypothetical protein
MILMLHLGRLVLPACGLRAVNLHRGSLKQGLLPLRTTDQAIQRDHRRGVSCPGQRLMTTRAANVKIDAVN